MFLCWYRLGGYGYLALIEVGDDRLLLCSLLILGKFIYVWDFGSTGVDIFDISEFITVCGTYSLTATAAFPGYYLVTDVVVILVVV